jgi:hypothetical protein
MAGALRKWCCLLLTLWAGILLPGQALAYTLLNCTADGKVVENTALFYTDTNAPRDAPSFCSDVNPRNPSDKTIRPFSWIICSYVTILNEVLGRVYCGMQYSLQQYVAMALTIYVGIFGLQILMGTTQMTSKEMLGRFIKIGFVWMLVSNYNFGVNYIFTFLIDFANEGMWWMFSAIKNQDQTTIQQIMAMPDNAGGISSAVPAYIYLDQLIYNGLSGKFIDNNQELIGFFAVLAFAFPPIFLIAAYWLWTTFMIFVRVLISFIMTLTGLAFLVALSPIFFCFLLFQPTMQFFETWTKFMVSFALQVVIVFAVVSLWIMAMLQFVGFFDQLANVVFLEQRLERAGPVSNDVQSFGVCPYIVSAGTTLRGPNVRCADPFFNPFAVEPGTGRLTEAAQKDNNDLISLSNLAPSQAAGPCSQDPNCAYGDETADNAVQYRLNRLFYFVIYHLMTLIIVAYAFDALLKQAPFIAQQLAGPQYVPILGQGYGGLGYRGIKSASKELERRGGGAADMARSAVRDIVEDSRNLAGNRATPGG